MSTPRRLKKIARRNYARELEHHNYRYMSWMTPNCRTNEYDALFRELKTLETDYPELRDPNSPTQRVGAPPLQSFENRRHGERDVQPGQRHCAG